MKRLAMLMVLSVLAASCSGYGSGGYCAQGCPSLRPSSTGYTGVFAG